MTNVEALSELEASIVGCGFQCHIETYVKAIEALEKQKILDEVYMDIKPLMGLDEWKEEVCRLAEKESKYRWHDLRKNPDDLPDVMEWVLCSCQGRMRQVLRMGPGGDWLTWNPDIEQFMHSFVIAWKYIEPFEEVKE